MNDIDLSKGNVKSLLLKLALPAVAAQLVNLIYNMVDRIYIGHIPNTGDIALTGLGLCLPVVMLVMAFSVMVGAGGAPQAAIAMGQGDNDRAEKILGNAVTVLIFFSLGLTVILELFAPNLLMLFGASENTLPYALSYFRIYAAGTVFVMMAQGLNLFITTQGFAKIAMRAVIIGAVINIILDPIFIFALHMNVKGAALATIISQSISSVWILSFLCGDKTSLKIKKDNLKIDGTVIKPVLLLGLAPFIMTATESVLNICFNSSLSKYGGDIAVGAMTIIGSISQMQFLPVQGIAQGAQPIISFNYGANKLDRVREAYRTLIAVCFGFTLIYWCTVMLWPRAFVMIFNNTSETLISETVFYLKIYMAVTGIFGLQGAIQQIFMALGKAKQSLFIACLRKIILLIPLIYILPAIMSDKVFAVFLAEPIADLVSVITCVALFLFTIRELKNTESN